MAAHDHRRGRSPARCRFRGPLGLACLALIAACAGLLPAGAAQAVGEPVNTAPPVLTLSGSTLITSDGTWLGQSRPFAYAWFRCASTALESCTQVPGQTNPSYPITAADSGKRIRSRVTAFNEVASASSFSGPTATIPAAPPPPPPAAPKLDPFPRVVIAGRRRGSLTLVSELTVSGPRGALVRMRCRGRGCPVSRTGGTIGRRGRLRLRRAERTYRAGAVIEIRVLDEDEGRIGKFTRVRFRRGIPVRMDSCLAPGASAPSRCS